MKSEKGVTLSILVIYVMIFTLVLAMLSNLSSYIYGNMNYVNDRSIVASEFSKFNSEFIKDVKNSTEADVKYNSSGILQITFSNGSVYRYTDESIYKDEQKIARSIENFTAELVDTGSKKYITIAIQIGANDETNYSKEINYVLKYW